MKTRGDAHSLKPGDLVRLNCDPMVGHRTDTGKGALWVIVEDRDSLEKRENASYEYRKQEEEYYCSSYDGDDCEFFFKDEMDFVRKLTREELLTHGDEDVRALA